MNKNKCVTYKRDALKQMGETTATIHQNGKKRFHKKCSDWFNIAATAILQNKGKKFVPSFWQSIKNYSLKIIRVAIQFKNTVKRIFLTDVLELKKLKWKHYLQCYRIKTAHLLLGCAMQTPTFWQSIKNYYLKGVARKNHSRSISASDHGPWQRSTIDRF